MLFGQFPILNCGIGHSGSQPFNYGVLHIYVSLFVYLQIKKQDQPTFPQLIDFPTSAGGEGLNIIKEIGIHYNMLGVFLLNDKNGATILALKQQHHSRATSINFEILQQWIQGSGEKPVTWETLVKVLRKIKLHTLADKIESSLS